MKKISYMLLGLLGIMATVSSCTETKDENPTLQKPTKFEVNTPAFVNQTYELSEGGVMEITCSQPDYGCAVIVNYTAQVSMTPDFADFREIAPVEPTKAAMQIPDADIAIAMCALNGIKGADDWNPDDDVQTVYLRVKASISGVEGYDITSEPIEIKSVKYYLAVKSPAYIYLVGSPEGWKGPSDDQLEHYIPWRLYESQDAIGSNVFYGTFELPEAPVFRFYTALTGWDKDSYGSQEGDNPIDYEFVNGRFEGTLVKGKGSFQFPKFTGGTATIVVDMNNMTVTIIEGGL